MESGSSRVVDALPGLVWTASLGGEIDFLNQQWFDYTGFSRDGAFGGAWQAAVHPGDLGEIVGGWGAITRGGKPAETVVRLRRFDGAYRRFLMRISPVTDASGQVVKWCGVGTDIEGERPIYANNELPIVTNGGSFSRGPRWPSGHGHPHFSGGRGGIRQPPDAGLLRRDTG